MSELKADNTFVFGEECLAYKKSEVDKVIENKDKEIASLKDSIGKLLKAKTEQVIDEVLQRCIIYGEGFVPVEHAMRLVAELRHQKYKRCLAMAMRCGDACDKWMMKKATAIELGKDGVEYYHQARRKLWYYMRWQKRWLELAEKFKEAK